jgi:group I intron endonuclease
MHYYLYKVTNLVNSRFYVGVHKTRDMDDGYMGSGKVIQQAIEKYGIENFQKEILEVFDNSKAMYDREKEIVTEEFLKTEDVYNLRLGGNGGWEYINNNGLNFTEESLKKRRISLIKWHSQNDTTKENNGFFGKKHSVQTKQHISEKRKEYYDNGGEHPKGMLNKEHSLDTKNHLSEVMKIKSTLIGKKGLEHPVGGTKWYNNGMSHMRAEQHPGEGWVEGRIFKPRKKKS